MSQNCYGFAVRVRAPLTLSLGGPSREHPRLAEGWSRLGKAPHGLRRGLGRGGGWRVDGRAAYWDGRWG